MPFGSFVRKKGVGGKKYEGTTWGGRRVRQFGCGNRGRRTGKSSKRTPRGESCARVRRQQENGCCQNLVKSRKARDAVSYMAAEPNRKQTTG